jgi:hypothetical protein
MPQSSVRLELEISPENLNEWDSLLGECGLETRKELLNSAMTMFKWAVRHAREGHSIAAIDDTKKKYFELDMPFLSRVSSRRSA